MTPTKTKREVTPEGQKAAENIAAARAALNAGGTRQGATIVAPTKPVTPVITPATLEPSVSPVVTPVPTPTAAPKLQADLEATQEDALTQKVAAEKTAAEATKGTALQSYLDQLSQAKGLTTLTSEAYAAKGGVNDITPELNDINDQIRREQLALRRATESVTGAGGQSKAQAQAQINNLQRESLAKQADLSIIQMAVQGRYDSAKEIADRAVAAQFEQQQQAIDIAKFDYTENKELFSKAEQREYDLLFSDRERKLETARQDASDIKQFALTALEKGASVAETQKMMQSKTLDEAISIGGSYLRPKPVVSSVTGGGTYTTPTGSQVTVPTFEEFIDAKQNEMMMSFTPETRESYRKEYEAEVELMGRANSMAKLSPVAADAVKNPAGFFTRTATEKGQILTELANAGIDTTLITQGKKRPLTATQADDFVQAQIARNGVVELKKKLDQLVATGPIVGGVRQLNPYDPQVVAIKAELTRIVPGLARGIYKEVGVLTDQDVARYMDTLANPTLTPTQREQIHNDTMSKIDQSINIAASTYSDLGYDLGKFDAGAVTSSPDNLTDDEAYTEYLRITGQ